MKNLEVPDIHLPNWLARCAENAPEHLAIRCGEIAWSFAELDQQATRLARQLAMAGVCEGSHVALLAGNGLSYVVTVHALTRLGAILVPLNTRLTCQDLSWQIRAIHASHLLSDILHEKTATDIVQAMPRLIQGTLQVQSESNDIVLKGFEEDLNTPLYGLIDLSTTQAIMYTSGTTGSPKGVIITYGMQWWNAIGSALNLGHHQDDRWLACLPLFHIGGLAILLRNVIYGISVILHERFEPAAVNRAICEDRVTIISVVAVMLQRMLATLESSEGQDDYPSEAVQNFSWGLYGCNELSSLPTTMNCVSPSMQNSDLHPYPSTLRCVLLGGGPAPHALLEDCVARAIPVVQTYGLTEACSQAATLSPVDALRKLGSVGRPLPQVQMRILNEGQSAASGEPGTIYLKGPSITPGYVHQPEFTAETIHDGWLCTGDIGYLDAEGYLYVLDRRSDLIISGGENIYPAEIESVLLTHPDVAEAGVCGRPDAEWGQVPVAFVCLHANHTMSPEALLTHAAQRLARYQIPRVIYIVDRLPRNSAKKLLRRDLPGLLEKF
jgi:o-succinylbenzoate---CoA ligase